MRSRGCWGQTSAGAAFDPLETLGREAATDLAKGQRRLRMTDDLDRALERCTSFSSEVRESGRCELEGLFAAGSAVAGVELAHIVLSAKHVCSLGKPQAVDLLAREVRLSGDPLAFLNLYYYGGDLVSDDLMFELLTLAAPNSVEAREILEARLPGWRHPLA